jgi:hypothetical protein
MRLVIIPLSFIPPPITPDLHSNTIPNLTLHLPNILAIILINDPAGFLDGLNLLCYAVHFSLLLLPLRALLRRDHASRNAHWFTSGRTVGLN